ncbi:MAG: glycoside hydrolase family 3 N-terminal domain-containing protein, partial [Kiritimatiellia bacterium]
VEDLLSRMTVEEKTCQATTLYGYPRVLMDAEPVPQWKERVWKDGIGNIDEHCNGYGNKKKVLKGPPSIIAKHLNKTQRWFVEETRLGIPCEFTNEGIRGACVSHGTSFPAQQGLGCTWNRALIADVGRVTARENKALGFSNTYAPILDLPRDPRWGRIVECYGEDPYLVSELGVTMVQALQANGTTSSPKHYCAYAVPEGGRDDRARTAPSLGPRELHSLYMRPFRRAFVEGRAHGTMSSYNDWDGDPVSASEYFLTDLLRGEYGFDGYVVSDSEAVEFIYTKHRVVPDYKHAVAKALAAGLNIRTTFRQPETFTLPLRAAVKEGILPMETLDQRTREVLRYKFSIGLFDNPYVSHPEAADKIVGCADHQAVAKQASRQSIVMLKNDGLLPLNAKKLKKVLVCGPNARDNHFGHSRYGPQNIEVDNMDESVRKALGESVEVLYARGCDLVDERFPESDILPEPPTYREQMMIDKAVAKAGEADAVLLFLGGKNHITVGESASRSSLALPGHQATLLKALYAVGKPVVLVLVDGRPSAINWADKHIPAIVYAGFGGQHGGAALADVLFGKLNPSAKSSFTWPKCVGQIPYAFPYKPASRSAGRARVDGSLYPFGHGLSYTTFKYSELKIANRKIRRGEPVKVSFTLTNTGKVRGAEVPQLYLHDVVCSVNRWFIELAGFDRVELDPGESKNVAFTLTDEQLQVLDINMNWSVEPGVFRIYIGSSSEDIRLPADAFKEPAWGGQVGNEGFPASRKSLDPESKHDLAPNEFEVI